MENWIPVHRRLADLCLQAERFQAERLTDARWKEWSGDAKSLLRLALGREHLARRAFRKLCDKIDAIEASELSGTAQSEERKRRLPKLVALLEEVQREGRGSQVFVAHGRDLARADATALCLHDAGLEPIVLYKQPDKGRAVIEKFEQYAKTSFAVVLLTADDLGALKADAEAGELQPRARENAILELGFFAGRLGRENVCVIADEGVEPPSDFKGVLILRFDAAGEWKHALLKRLREAGFAAK